MNNENWWKCFLVIISLVILAIEWFFIHNDSARVLTMIVTIIWIPIYGLVKMRPYELDSGYSYPTAKATTKDCLKRGRNGALIAILIILAISVVVGLRYDYSINWMGIGLTLITVFIGRCLSGFFEARYLISALCLK